MEGLYHPGMRPYHLPSSPGGAGSTNFSQSAISRWGWGFHTVRGGIDPGITVFVPGVLEL